MTDILRRLRDSLRTRYEVSRELGAGGWATVFLATDLKHQRQVALKVLRPEVASAIGLDRFVREIEISARLRHPNILPLYDSGEADGLFYYVMPFVEGESLREVLRRDKQLPVEHALRITQEVADALALAHRHGIIHRDIKPENILLDAGHAVVADFGIARAVLEVEPDKLTGSGIAVGTPEYMSPEQATAGSEADGRSDIYSLGCVLYEMLTGEPPFEGRTLQATIARHLTGAIPRASDFRKTVSLSVDAIVTQALAKVPADRFGGAEQMADALERARTGKGEPGREVDVGKTQALAKPWALMAVGAIAIGVVGWFVSRSFSDVYEGTSASPVLVVPPFANFSADTAQDYVAAGITEAVITELTKVGDLTVISGTPERLQEDDSGKAFLLNGTVLAQGEQLKITARLEEVLSGRSVWADDYDRDLHDVLSLIGEVARTIAVTVEAELTPEEEARMLRTLSVNPEAYSLYLRGRFHWHRRTAADLQRSVGLFERSLEVDSSSALAYAGLADAYRLYPQYGVPGFSRSQAFREAERYAQEALARDSTLGEARTALAHLRFVAHRDWAGAELEFRRALDLSPGYSELHQWYGEYLRARGDAEAGLVEVRLAHHLAPDEPVVGTSLAMGLWCVGRFEEAEAQARRILEEQDNEYAGAHNALALALLAQSRFEQMAAAALAAGFPSSLVNALRRGLEDESNRASAVAAIAAASAQVGAFQSAVLYAAVRQVDSTFVALRQAEAQNDVNAMLFLTTAPVFGILRDDQRYDELVARFGIPMNQDR